jgi:hypothetical protein
MSSGLQENLWSSLKIESSLKIAITPFKTKLDDAQDDTTIGREYEAIAALNNNIIKRQHSHSTIFRWCLNCVVGGLQKSKPADVFTVTAATAIPCHKHHSIVRASSRKALDYIQRNSGKIAVALVLIVGELRSIVTEMSFTAAPSEI